MKTLPTVSGGSGPRLVRHTGVARVVPQPEGEAGVFVPEALAGGQLDGSAFLIARSDFDAGDVPDNAVARFTTIGVRAVLAPGFEKTLYLKCITYGILPVILEDGVVGALADRAESGAPLELTLDLERKSIECPGMESVTFDVDPRVRNKLLLGLTDLEEMRRYVGDAETLRNADRKKRPWLYGG